MKIKTIALCMISLLILAGCAAKVEEKDTGIILLPASSQNFSSMVLLQDKNTGDLICCSDTATSTAEECARAFEQEDCYVRVDNIPSRPAQYDPLTTNTFPTRRWRETETSPRW